MPQAAAVSSCQDVRVCRARHGLRQHLRRLPRHPAHARHVQEEKEMSSDLAALLYLAAGVLFILALRGLSSPATSRQGNYLGMVGMAIAMVTTLAVARPQEPLTWALIAGGIGIGGGIGAVIARRIPMTAMPELVAAFHSLVGLAAVLVAAAALYAPEAFGIGKPGAIHTAEPDRDVARRRHRRHHLHRLDHRLRQAVGAHVGQADHSAGAPRASISGSRSRSIACIVMFCLEQSDGLFLGDRAAVVAVRHPDHHPDRRRRHAGRHLDAELLFGLGGGRHRLHARQHRADHHRRAGRLVRRDPVLHHVQGHEPLLHLRDPRRVRRRGGGAGRRGRAEAGQARLGGGRRLPDEERRQGHHRAGLRHGGGAGAACVARDGRRAEEGRRRGQIRDPSCRGPHAGPHERAARRGQCSLRRGVRARGHQLANSRRPTSSM